MTRDFASTDTPHGTRIYVVGTRIYVVTTHAPRLRLLDATAPLVCFHLACFLLVPAFYLPAFYLPALILPAVFLPAFILPAFYLPAVFLHALFLLVLSCRLQDAYAEMFARPRRHGCQMTLRCLPDYA